CLPPSPRLGKSRSSELLVLVRFGLEALAILFLGAFAGGLLTEGVAPQEVVQIAERGDADHDGKNHADRAEKEAQEQEKRGAQKEKQSERQGGFAVSRGAGILHTGHR